MSIITKILLALVAGLVLFLAPQAKAESVSATEVHACTQAWATTWAQQRGKTVEDAMRYARRIQREPATTLSINGKQWVFGPTSHGATVWKTCEASLISDQQLQQTAATRPTIERTHGGLTFDQMAHQSDRLTRENADLTRRLEAKNWFLPFAVGFILCLVLVGIVGTVIYMTRIEKIVWVKKRPFDTIGSSGHRTPRQAHDPDRGYDDPTEGSS